MSQAAPPLLGTVVSHPYTATLYSTHVLSSLLIKFLMLITAIAA